MNPVSDCGALFNSGATFLAAVVAGFDASAGLVLVSSAASFAAASLEAGTVVIAAFSPPVVAGLQEVSPSAHGLVAEVSAAAVRPAAGFAPPVVEILELAAESVITGAPAWLEPLPTR